MGSETLNPEFSRRIQEVFGLGSAPVNLDSLRHALRERWTAGDYDVEFLFTGGETRHKVEFGGQVKYAHCALDALIFSAITGHKIKLESRCPHCAETVTVEARGSAIRSSHPQAVLSWGVSRQGKGPVWENACPFINLFPSEEHYRAWAAEKGDALTTMLSLEEAVQLVGGPLCC